jgi:hypothetical protein
MCPVRLRPSEQYLWAKVELTANQKSGYYGAVACKKVVSGEGEELISYEISFDDAGDTISLRISPPIVLQVMTSSRRLIPSRLVSSHRVPCRLISPPIVLQSRLPYATRARIYRYENEGPVYRYGQKIGQVLSCRNPCPRYAELA